VLVALNIPAIQQALSSENLDGWLLYDFHGSNPIAVSLTGLGGADKMTTRRWYYLIPAKGEPRALVHAIERHNLDALPGDKRPYAGRAQLESGLEHLLQGCRRVAMEYSPGCNIPYVSRVDAGTVEAVRKLGVDVVSSGDLAQRFEAVWSPETVATHRDASTRLYRVKDGGFQLVRDALKAGKRLNEYDVQQHMMHLFEKEGLITDEPPIVGAQENAANPHYAPTSKVHRDIRPNEVLLLDLWAKIPQAGAVFADITWVGYTGREVPDEYAKVFAVARDARDAAIALVQKAAHDGRALHGWEVDRACREVIERAGYGQYFIHRTGHSLGESVHGNGVHMDDYETHDERRLIPGTGFTIEPGIYLEGRFGVRTEVNMVVGERDATVTGPTQTELVTLT
jgi:Xaa-Pro dipeptidase